MQYVLFPVLDSDSNELQASISYRHREILCKLPLSLMIILLW